MIALTVLALAAAPATLDLDKPAEIVAAMQKAGYQAELKTDGEGDPMIESTANGAVFVVGFFGCEKGRHCTDLQFYAGWSSEEKEDPSQINGFNQEYRFIRAYIDAEDDPVVEMDVMGIDGKVPVAQFDRSLEAWSALMGRFMLHLAD